MCFCEFERSCCCRLPPSSFCFHDDAQSLLENVCLRDRDITIPVPDNVRSQAALTNCRAARDAAENIREPKGNSGTRLCRPTLQRSHRAGSTNIISQTELDYRRRHLFRRMTKAAPKSPSAMTDGSGTIVTLPTHPNESSGFWLSNRSI